MNFSKEFVCDDRSARLDEPQEEQATGVSLKITLRHVVPPKHGDPVFAVEITEIVKRGDYTRTGTVVAKSLKATMLESVASFCRHNPELEEDVRSAVRLKDEEREI